jgi:hypothetical protein
LKSFIAEGRAYSASAAHSQCWRRVRFTSDHYRLARGNPGGREEQLANKRLLHCKNCGKLLFRVHWQSV